MARTSRARRAARPVPRAAPVLDSLLVEGALIATAQLAAIAAGEAVEQTAADYRLRPGLALRDEIPLAYRVGQTLFARLTASPEPSAAATAAFAQALMRDVLGFPDSAIGAAHGAALGGRVPVVVVSPADGLDSASAALTAAAGRRTSAALALQDRLNGDDDALWGMACNGLRLRLMRDNPSLTRPAYIEADLRRIFEADALSDFSALWLLLHASRFGQPGTSPADCALERWRDAGQKVGETARERLREGVEKALAVIGDGLLRHPANSALRDRLRDGELPLPEFFNQLLQLAYRIIFLLVAEDRGLLHPPAAPVAARALYADGYSLSRLRARAVQPARDAHDDLWDGLGIIMAALARGEKRLGLPALDGLFAPGGTPDLDGAALSNRTLLDAVRGLAWLDGAGGAPVPVNWRDMETEELGSVYEALLELTPRLLDGGRGFAFAEGAETRGNQRKTTGSYYTPDSLVQALLASALDPVLDRVQAEDPGIPVEHSLTKGEVEAPDPRQVNAVLSPMRPVGDSDPSDGLERAVSLPLPADPAAALLGVRVLDPACGSGHFLLAAGRHIAARVARLRAGGTAGAAEYRHALRDVARACLHGVDRNPMAIMLAKVALWIETVEPGLPLGFLDANLRCGDALLGVFDLDALRLGIPDAAYKPLAGDDPAACRALKARNRAEREGQGSLDAERGGGGLPPMAPLARAAVAWRALPEDSPAEIVAKRARFGAARSAPDAYALHAACDLYVAAFLSPKPTGTEATPRTALVPTTGAVWARAAGGQVYGPLEGQAVDLARAARAFHWPLEFPDVMACGGFDVVLGNPPWDTMSPDAKEFFSPHDGQVRFMSPDDQKTRITELLTLTGLAEAWDAYCQRLYALASFFKDSGRYTLFAEGNLGKGDFNVYRMFAELALRATRPRGRAAQFVPENLYNGANAAAIRRFLFDACKLNCLIAFENTRKIWFDIHTAARFCLYVATPGSTTTSFAAAFGINSRERLAALSAGLPIELPVSLVEEFSPEAFAIAEVAHPSDISISRKLYARLPKFGAELQGAAMREYMTEIHMGNDREDFGNDSDGVPLYEGRMVEAFDHRAKAYVSGRGRSAVWQSLQFGSAGKAITPQWRLSRSRIPSKAEARSSEYRLGFCDVGGVTNARFLMAALVPMKAICGHSVPTILFNPKDDSLSLLWLGIANSFCIDFLARKKGALHITYTVLDSLPLPRSYTGSPVEAAIVRRSMMLTATGPEMAEFWKRGEPLLGISAEEHHPCENPVQRRALRAELDVLIARDFFGLNRDEMRYLLDPVDILGPNCGFETFGALKRAETRASGGLFTTRDLILDTWDNLPVPSNEDLAALLKHQFTATTVNGVTSNVEHPQS